jgi:hypothetical protein
MHVVRTGFFTVDRHMLHRNELPIFKRISRSNICHNSERVKYLVVVISFVTGVLSTFDFFPIIPPSISLHFLSSTTVSASESVGDVTAEAGIFTFFVAMTAVEMSEKEC